MTTTVCAQLVGISLHRRANVYRTGAGEHFDVYLHLRYRHLDRWRTYLAYAAPLGSPTVHPVMQRLGIRRYERSNPRTTARSITKPRPPTRVGGLLPPVNEMVGERFGRTVRTHRTVRSRTDAEWTIVFAYDLVTDDTVDILRYTQNTCEWYPTDALEFVLDEAIEKDGAPFVRSVRTKHMRQRYAMWHSTIPSVIGALMAVSGENKMHGLMPDVEWMVDEQAVANLDDFVPTETVLVRLTGEGQTLVLDGPPGIGKSHLAQLLVRLPAGLNRNPVRTFTGRHSGRESPYDGSPSPGCIVFETDAVDDLPEVIDAAVVVLGHRHQPRFLVDDVVARIPTGKAMVGELYVCPFEEKNEIVTTDL